MWRDLSHVSNLHLSRGVAEKCLGGKTRPTVLICSLISTGILRGKMPEQLWTSEVQERGAVCAHGLGTSLLLSQPPGLRIRLCQ